jgi:predicted dehydrogenase
VRILRGPEADRGRDPLTQGPAPAGRPREPVWEDVPLTHGATDNSRGLGVADLARAIRAGGPARANGELAYHVLDVMHATLESSAGDRHVTIASTAERPAPLLPLS